MSRPYTEDEMQKMFLDHLRTNVRYWINAVKRGEATMEEAVQGAVFSTLVVLDGEAADLPAMDLIPSPHPDDKQYYIDNDEDYFPEGVNISDGSLHDRFINDK